MLLNQRLGQRLLLSKSNGHTKLTLTMPSVTHNNAAHNKKAGTRQLFLGIARPFE